MNGRHTLLLAAGCTFLATGALSEQDRAVPRSGGGSSASSARSAPSARSSGASHSRRGSGSSGSFSRAPSRGLTTAERRHPRAGTGTGTGSRYGGRYPSHPIYPGYPGWGWGGYAPAYWNYWWPYRSYGYGYGWGGGGYGPVGAGAVYSYADTDRGSIRVLVDPSEARVYIDGYYAGVVDDFDGLFQRLHLAPGRHELSLRLTGYKTHRVRFYVGSGATLKLDYELEEGTGETFQDLTGGLPVRETRRSSLSFGETPRVEREEEAAAEELRLRVSPIDASIYVDGEFRGTGREAATLALTPGQHRIEVVRPGYRTEDREVEVGGRTPTEVTIELERP